MLFENNTHVYLRVGQCTNHLPFTTFEEVIVLPVKGRCAPYDLIWSSAEVILWPEKNKKIRKPDFASFKSFL